MPINAIKILDSQQIDAGGSALSEAIDLSTHKGFFSIQIALTGDGTAKCEALVSNDESDYIEPDGASDVCSGHTKTSGPGSDGKALYGFRAPVGKSLKIKVTETGAANGVTISAWIAYQH